MNDADSKKLEEIEAARVIKYNFTMENWAMKPIRDDLQDMAWLISTVKEKEQEIERLEMIIKSDRNTWTTKLYDSCKLWKNRAEKAKAELAKWTKPHDDADLQALKEQADQHSLAAQRAYINGLDYHLRHTQAALADFKKAHAAYGVEAEKQIDEQQDELSACKDELEKCKAAQDREG